ncbi:MAG: nicotinic acid mononucleotide adenylyltransferase, partial [Pseudomonadota bacterium]
ASFHRWEGWRWIIETMPIAVFARPGQQVRAGLSPAATVYHERRLAPDQARLLGRSARAHWVLLPGPMSPASSSAIRADGGWERPAR